MRGGREESDILEKTTTLRSLFFVIKRQTTRREIVFALGSRAVQILLLGIGAALLALGFAENGLLKVLLAILIGAFTFALVPVIFALRTEQSIYSQVRRLGPRLRVLCCHLVGRTESGLYRWRDAVRWYEKVLDIGEVPRASDLHGIVLCDLAGALIFGGDRDRALAEYDRGLRVYARQGSASDLGRARILIGRMNAFIHFGDYSGTFDRGMGKAEQDFLEAMRFCSPEDSTVQWGEKAYERERDAGALTVADPYGGSKAHCQYAWGLMEGNTERALWHARMALAYSRLIEDSVFSPLWGLRDGAVGSYWREAVALFSIADCYTLLDDLAMAETYYSQSHRRIPYKGRKCYFTGHHWWLYLCRRGRSEEARECLEQTLRVSNQDDYRWRAALAHCHYGDLERDFSNTADRISIRRHYEAGFAMASEYGLRVLVSMCEERLAALDHAP